MLRYVCVCVYVCMCDVYVQVWMYILYTHRYCASIVLYFVATCKRYFGPLLLNKMNENELPIFYQVECKTLTQSITFCRVYSLALTVDVAWFWMSKVKVTSSRGQILWIPYLMNYLQCWWKLQPLAPTDDLVRFWRSKTKRQGHSRLKYVEMKASTSMLGCHIPSSSLVVKM